MIYYVTLGFGPAHLLSQALENLKSISENSFESRHIYLDQHYPIHKEYNRRSCRSLCDAFGMEYFDAGKNLGLHRGFNLALEKIGLKDEDLVIAFDHDMYPMTKGADLALITALNQANDVGWATLMFKAVYEEFLRGHPHKERMLGHVKAWELGAPIMNSMCAWRGSFLNRAGGLKEPSEFYGGLEVAMWPELIKQGMKWVFLPGFWEDQRIHLRADPEYRAYKWAHAHDGTWLGDFESYLKAKHPNLLGG